LGQIIRRPHWRALGDSRNRHEQTQHEGNKDPTDNKKVGKQYHEIDPSIGGITKICSVPTSRTRLANVITGFSVDVSGYVSNITDIRDIS
jgi:hypothetical protein